MKNGLILLPGEDKQLNILVNNFNVVNKKVLVAGSASEEIAKKIYLLSNTPVEVIVEDYDSLINSRVLLDDSENVNVKMMDFETTDYSNEQFDVIYAQASLSNKRRKGIIKEFKRILKKDGVICIGEIIKLQKQCPQFITDIFVSANLDPQTEEEIIKFYTERDFNLAIKQNLNSTLKIYYSTNLRLLNEHVDELSGSEKSYYKKLINQISHESKVYLKQGGDKFMGFAAFLFKRV